MCVTMPTFSILINNTAKGYIEGRKGLRQGDPLSPILFIVVMEALARLLDLGVQNKSFSFHLRCGKAKLTHICFADNMLIFTKGDLQSLNGVINIIFQFSEVTELCMNAQKSSLLVGNFPLNEARLLDNDLGIHGNKIFGDAFVFE